MAARPTNGPHRPTAPALAALMALLSLAGLVFVTPGCGRVCDAIACMSVVRVDMGPYLREQKLPPGTLARICLNGGCAEVPVSEAIGATAPGVAPSNTTAATMPPTVHTLGVNPAPNGVVESLSIVALGGTLDAARQLTLDMKGPGETPVFSARPTAVRLVKEIRKNGRGQGCDLECWRATVQLTGDGVWRAR